MLKIIFKKCSFLNLIRNNVIISPKYIPDVFKNPFDENTFMMNISSLKISKSVNTKNTFRKNALNNII